MTYDIEPLDDVVKRVVTHDRLEADPDMASAVAGGRPRVLSSPKSRLESGRPLPEVIQCAIRASRGAPDQGLFTRR